MGSKLGWQRTTGRHERQARTGEYHELVLHQATTDLRAVRWPLALWLVVLLADGLVLGLKLDRFIVDRDSADRIYLVFGAVGNVEMAFGWLIAARIIHADPIETTTAFWLTRPLSAGMLLVSKLLLTGALFLILPNAVAAGVAAAMASPARPCCTSRPSAWPWTPRCCCPSWPWLRSPEPAPLRAHRGGGRIAERRRSGRVPAAILLADEPDGAAHGSRDRLRLRRGSRDRDCRQPVPAGTPVPDPPYEANDGRRRGSHRSLLGIWNLWPWSFWTPTRFQPAAIAPGVFDAARVRLAFDSASLRRTDPSRGEIGVRGAFQVHGIPVGWVAHIQSGRSELRFATAPAVVVPGGPVSNAVPPLGIVWHAGRRRRLGI